MTLSGRELGQPSVAVGDGGTSEPELPILEPAHERSCDRRLLIRRVPKQVDAVRPRVVQRDLPLG